MSEIKRRLREQAEAARLREDQREKETQAVLSAVVVAQEDQLWRLQAALNKAQTWHVQAQTQAAEEEKGEPVRKFKWATSLDANPTFDPAFAKPRENIFDVGWGPSVTGVVRSGNGSLGVFFVNTEKGAIVLKGSRSIASEAFASLLAAKWDKVYCAALSALILPRESDVMIARLSTLDAARHASIFLSSQMHVFVNTFIPGRNLQELTADSAAAIFGVGRLSESGKDLLLQLGRILALDVLVNNGDRLPLIWENRGNAGNIIIAQTDLGPRMYSIDTQVLPIGVEHDGHMDAYMDKVIKLLTALAQSGLTAEIPQFAAVRQKLKEFLHYDIGTAGSLALQRGFLDVAAHTKDIKLDQFELQNWRELLRAIDDNIVGLDSIQPDFIMAVWSAFAAHSTP